MPPRKAYLPPIDATPEEVAHALFIDIPKKQSKGKRVKAIERSYLDNIYDISEKYLERAFTDKEQIKELRKRTEYLRNGFSKEEIVSGFCEVYYNFHKEIRQNSYKKSTSKMKRFLAGLKSQNIGIIWGDCLKAMKAMNSETISLMVTSPPYYNAREYSQWKDINFYLEDMRKVIKESYRVLENHRAFVFNVGDITGNDNRHTKSTWGNRRIPLGAYFIGIFEECGFTFVDDFIWDKGEVESQRHKNGDTPYPMYQYPMNCYEHIMVFVKHEKDETIYPCPVCGCLKVNGNAYSGVGIKSWECKNLDCFERSKANRGKRFSARSFMMDSMKQEENIISQEFLKSWRRDIVRIKPVFKINSKGENTIGHTAPFPFEIPEYAIKTMSGVGEYVYDPFAGSFTTAIQASKLGRIGLGSEIAKTDFKDAIIRNINKHCLPIDNVKIKELSL